MSDPERCWRDSRFGSTCDRCLAYKSFDVITVDELGTRICIMGPSNSGKSTMAEAISRARGLVPIHLDQLHHLPHTDWVPRPAGAFAALHDAAIMGSCWVIEGNHSRLLPQRLERATGFILLDVSTPVSLYRYLRRCWFERDRRGALEGGRDSVKWDIIRHITVTTRANRSHYQQMFRWHSPADSDTLAGYQHSDPAHIAKSRANSSALLHEFTQDTKAEADLPSAGPILTTMG